MCNQSCRERRNVSERNLKPGAAPCGQCRHRRKIPGTDGADDLAVRIFRIPEILPADSFYG